VIPRATAVTRGEEPWYTSPRLCRCDAHMRNSGTVASMCGFNRLSFVLPHPQPARLWHHAPTLPIYLPLPLLPSLTPTAMPATAVEALATLSLLYMRVLASRRYSLRASCPPLARRWLQRRTAPAPRSAWRRLHPAPSACNCQQLPCNSSRRLHSCKHGLCHSPSDSGVWWTHYLIVRRRGFAARDEKSSSSNGGEITAACCNCWHLLLQPPCKHWHLPTSLPRLTPLRMAAVLTGSV